MAQSRGMSLVEAVTNMSSPGSALPSACSWPSSRSSGMEAGLPRRHVWHRRHLHSRVDPEKLPDPTAVRADRGEKCHETGRRYVVVPQALPPGGRGVGLFPKAFARGDRRGRSRQPTANLASGYRRLMDGGKRPRAPGNADADEEGCGSNPTDGATRGPSRAPGGLVPPLNRSGPRCVNGDRGTWSAGEAVT